MKIVVAVKTISERVPSSLEDNGYQDGNKYVLDPFSEVALEQGLRLREQGVATEVTVVTVSPSEQGLRAAMAMGATSAVQIPYDCGDCASIAKLLQQAVEHLGSDLVLLGKQSGDGDNHQVSQRLAQQLGWPVLSGVDQLVIDGDSLAVSGLCSGGRGQYATQLPAVISADLRLCSPRYPSLPNLMKARRAPITQLQPQLDSDPSGIQLVEQQQPLLQRQGIQLENVEQLAALLQGEKPQ